MVEDKFKLRKRVKKNENGQEDVLLTIGIEPDEVEDGIFIELMKRHWDSGFEDREKFLETLKKDDPKFYEEATNNIPYQRAYLFGILWHTHLEPQAYLESMHVKKNYRNRGYATEMMTEMLKDVDAYCYPTYGRVTANEKVDDFTWDLSGGKSLIHGYNYGIELSVEEYNQRQEKLLNFYKRFGFDVVEKSTYSDGRNAFVIKRPNQCDI